MKQRIIFWAVLVSKIVTWILAVLVICWILLKLTNHSPTTDQVMISMMSVVVSGIFGLFALVIHFLVRFSRFQGKVDRYMHETDRKFEKMERIMDRCVSCKNHKAV